MLYRFDRQPCEGIVNPGTFLQASGIELITLEGTMQAIGYQEFKALCFGSEGARPDLFSEHTVFERRPKVPGLWTRFTFRDGDQLDGILSHNLLEWPETGYFITPPRAGGSRQRVFIPRAALTSTELWGVVGRSSISGGRPKTRGAPGQLNIFDS